MKPTPAISRRRYFVEEEDDRGLASLVKTTIVTNNKSSIGNPGMYHFLGACSLCGRSIDPKSDVYMYMGDTAFCTQECRERRIEEDEAKKRMKIKGSSTTNSTSLKREIKKSGCNFYGVPTTGPMAAV